MRATMSEAAQAMGGEILVGDPAARWNGIVLDSRRAGAGELFFALAGEQTDGHRFVEAALSAGAAGAVVERAIEGIERGALIRVPSAYEALHELTRWGRRRAPKHLVGITGSAGKTTTKDLLTAMLGRRFEVAPSPGNFNNLYGFPIALLGIPEETEWMVAEMGMSTPGELGGVSRLGRPDVAVFTNIAPVHLEQLGSIEAIVEAKAELLEGLSAEGIVVANADDANVLSIASRHSGRIVRYAIEGDADVRARSLRAEGAGTRFELTGFDGSIEIELPLLGRYNVYNFLAAAACSLALGVTHEEIAAATASVTPSTMRGVVHRLDRGAWVVDDSYNSNPEAAVKALEAARSLEGERYWAVLGSMLELGPESDAFHAEVGRAAVERGYTRILGVGDSARPLVEAARAAGGSADWFETRDAVLSAATSELAPNDVVLVKGSRGVGLETVVAALREAGAMEGAN